MDKLDNIIAAHQTPPPKTEITVAPLKVLRYRCHEHRYNIRYNEELETAEYVFDGQDKGIKTDISIAQRNYYVDSGYWKSQE